MLPHDCLTLFTLLPQMMADMCIYADVHGVSIISPTARVGPSQKSEPQSLLSRSSRDGMRSAWVLVLSL
jgi:hypothetical protein